MLKRLLEFNRMSRVKVIILWVYLKNVYYLIFPSDKFGVERYLYKGQCLDACPEAFYHTKERSCEPCSDHCWLCTSSTHCLKCNSSYYVSDGACTKLECGEGKHLFMCVTDNPEQHSLTSVLPSSSQHLLLLLLLISLVVFLTVSCLHTLNVFSFYLRGGGGSRLRRLHGL